MVTVHLVRDPQDQDFSPIYSEKNREWYAVAVKGAPDVVVNLCNRYLLINDQEVRPMDEAARQRVIAANDTLTKDALRVLGLAYRLMPVLPEEIQSGELERDLIFVGLIGMIDPPRAEVKPALALASQAGVRTVMITGDYPNTARAIAESIGLLRPGHQVMTGSQLNAIDDAGLQREMKMTDVFARVSPEHKMRIVDALRANGQVVAMTGDGGQRCAGHQTG